MGSMKEALSSKRGTFLATVRSNERVCDAHYRMVLELEHFPATRAGQFVQILCRPPENQPSHRSVEWREGEPPALSQPEMKGQPPMLRRPLSLAGRRDSSEGTVELDLIYRTVGTGTHWLATVRAGEVVSVLGPLGNHFTVDGSRPMAALVGGGVGIPPMLYLAETLAASGRKTVAFAGVRSAPLFPLRLLSSEEVSAQGKPSRCVMEFDAFGVDTGISTDDGSMGAPGTVSGPLTKWLDDLDDADAKVVVYACGPEPMMRAVGEICDRRGVPCQLSLERHMACGMGTCQSCICKIRAANEQGWEFRLCCKDGPVFDASDVIWD